MKIKDKAKRTGPHPRRLIRVTADTVRRDLGFWLPVVILAEAQGRLKGDSTSLELSLLIV